ncbi:MAG TPA: MBOAT family protein [Tepidisphaeraceae bacterium]|jgi:alginate O-acetyltransferase complex protein AlgI|nr:MBOAT family protein [Tepidisphaeraceae bacterium]
MVFSSILFLFFFLPAALLLYFASPRGGGRILVLTLLSFAFYAWSDPRFVLLLLWTAVFDYCMGNVIGGAWSRRAEGPSPGVRRVALVMSLTSSIGLLVWFKYAGFAQEMLNATLDLWGITGWTILAVVLPAGISFYTFESISYVVDIYRGHARPAVGRFLDEERERRQAVRADAAHRGRASEMALSPVRLSLLSRLRVELRAFVAFACYLSQFPHLVAGPIIRYQELEDQLHRPRLGLTRFAKGAVLMSLGLAKKVLIADTIGPSVDVAFEAGLISWHHAWYAAIAFAFQIYFDFSGYTDMAMGLAMMFGFRFPRNFDSPYRATSITDFWRRWHMTLSRWLRDYIYISLGGNRRGEYRTYVNLLLTMLIGGLWHGAGMTFILWGAFHGTWLAIERATGAARPPRRGLVVVRTVATFLGVCVGWVFFRAGDVWMAISRLESMLVPFSQTSPTGALSELFTLPVTLAMVAAALISFGGVEAWRVSRRLTLPRCAVAIGLFCVSIVVLAVRSSTPFLYFQF